MKTPGSDGLDDSTTGGPPATVSLSLLRNRVSSKYAPWSRAPGGEPRPAGLGGAGLPVLVGELGVGDGDPAAEGLDAGAELGALLRDGVELLVHERVDAGHEETGDARQAGDVLALREPLHEGGEVRLGDERVRRAREEQRDVDVDPLDEELPDGRRRLRGGRDLDEDVLASERVPEAPGLFQGRLRVVGHDRGDLEAHVAVAARGALVDRADVAAWLGRADRTADWLPAPPGMPLAGTAGSSSLPRDGA